MRSALERRQKMLEYLSDHRKVTLEELMTEFDISRRTAIRDIEELSCSAPINTVPGRYRGGICVADGWSVDRRYLHDDQEAVLRELMEDSPPDKQEIIQSILIAFAKPKINKEG